MTRPLHGAGSYSSGNRKHSETRSIPEPKLSRLNQFAILWLCYIHVQLFSQSPSAHVSILFLEEAQEEGEPSAPLPHSPGPSTEMHYETSQPASAVNTIPVAHAQMDRQENEEGWCRIAEEPPDE